MPLVGFICFSSSRNALHDVLEGMRHDMAQLDKQLEEQKKNTTR